MRVARARRKWAKAKARRRAIRAQPRKTTRRKSTSRLAATLRPALVTIKRRVPLRMTTKIQTGNGRVGSTPLRPSHRAKQARIPRDRCHISLGASLTARAYCRDLRDLLIWQKWGTGAGQPGLPG